MSQKVSTRQKVGVVIFLSSLVIGAFLLEYRLIATLLHVEKWEVGESDNDVWRPTDFDGDGWSVADGDCWDTNDPRLSPGNGLESKDINPGMREVCGDGIDNDCNPTNDC